MLRVNPGAFVLAHVVSRPVGPGRSVTRRLGEGFRPSQLVFGTWRLAPGAAQRFRGRSCSRSACTAPEPPSPAAAAGVRIGATAGVHRGVARQPNMRVCGSAYGGQPPRQVGDRAPGSTGIQQPAEEFSRRHGSAPRQGRGWRSVRIGPASQGQEVPKTPRSRVAMRGGGGSRGGRRCLPPRRVTGRAKSRPGV